MQTREENMGDQARTWLQENLRVVVSIFIVAAIALGIYSYSQRSQETSNDESAITASESTPSPSTSTATTPSKPATGSSIKTPSTALPAPTRETETAFVESAVRGDGTTHLARRALMHYLEKTPDSSLSGEHKVYIEDYLRKQLREKSGLRPNQSVEFSKDMIRQAIEKSKTLNGKQLQNLKKYSARVALYRS